MLTMMVLMFALAAPNPDAKLEADQRHAQELIPKLGHNSFRVREEAARELVKLGSAAKSALEAGVSNNDLEISDRCKQLLPQAIAHHLNEQIEKYLNNPDDRTQKDLPGLQRWVKLLGSDKASRELYRDVLKKNQDLLIELDSHPDRASKIYQNYMQEVHLRTSPNPNAFGTVNTGIDSVDVATFFFLGADVNCRKVPLHPAGYLQGSSFLSSAVLTSELSGKTGSALTKKLFAAWLEQEEQISLLNRALRLAAQHEVRECGPTTMKIACKTTLNPIYRSIALGAVAKLASKDIIEDPDFQKLLQDKTAIRVGANGAEIRDVALGVAIELTGQKMSEYGYLREPPKNINPGGGVILSYIYYSFGSDEKRDAAHKKWKEWTENNTKKK